ncbi:hypothetical protein [Nocardia sp. NPDC127526]|uniref:hypothetical protein n=1 Tax=Nocardia sp. NPDC127526 TaxID=3345393 RepID=UPI003644C07D
MIRHFTRGGRILAVAAALLIAAGCSCSRDDTTSTGTTTTPAPDPSRPPAAVRWESWQGVVLPISATDGPAETSTDAASGYSHTPQGAGLAAIQHTVRISIAPDGRWPLVAYTVLVSNAGKDEFVLSRSQYSITGPADPQYVPTILGYKITSYGDDRSEITVYSRYPDDSLSANSAVVVWQYGDWRLELPDPAAKIAVVTAIPELPGDIVRLEPPR